jgi:hypothetical protein
MSVNTDDVEPSEASIEPVGRDLLDVYHPGWQMDGTRRVHRAAVIGVL